MILITHGINYKRYVTFSSSLFFLVNSKQKRLSNYMAKSCSFENYSLEELPSFNVQKKYFEGFPIASIFRESNKIHGCPKGCQPHPFFKRKLIVMGSAL